MNKSDWLEVGLKILGTYFIVASVATFWKTLLAFMVSGRGTGGGGSWTLFSFRWSS